MKKIILALACALSLSTFQPTKPNPAAIAWSAMQLTSGGFAAYTVGGLLRDIRDGNLPKSWNKRYALLVLSTVSVASYTTGAAGLYGLFNELTH